MALRLRHILLSLLIAASLQRRFVSARFTTTGPVITLTLREPGGGSSSSDETKWLDLQSMHPTAIWSIGSTRRWFPALKSIKANVAYRYDDLKCMPSFIEAETVLETKFCDIHLQPSYEFSSKRTNLLVQASRDAASYMVARFVNRGERWLEFVKGCYTTNSVFGLGGARVTTGYDFLSNEATCKLEATTNTQRTKAVLNLESKNPTVSIVHALDQRHTIAPEISLRDAKITYQWNMALPSGSLRTKVDPTSAVYVTWTDRSSAGTWVTDLRLPLEGTTISALAADVRIRRQFAF